VATDRGRLAEADLVVRHQYETAVNNHHPMEPHAVVCWWGGRQSRGAHFDPGHLRHPRHDRARLPNAGIGHRVISRFLGGGFGCKGQLWWPWMFWAMLASRKTGRPVRLELTRAQMFTLVGRRQETVQDLGLGFSVDGRLTGIEHHALAQTSTHAEYSDSTAVYSRFLYACPNVTTTHRLIRTNEPQPVPMRAPGTAPGTFALESAFDEAAERLGIDPVELRMRNLPIMIRNRVARGAATACLSAIALVPNGSAGRSGRSRVPPPTDAGWSVGAWQARFIRQYAKPARSVSNWQ